MEPKKQTRKEIIAKANKILGRQIKPLREGFDQNEEQVRVKGLPNEALILEFMQMSGGDTNDGEFTETGKLKYGFLCRELDTRLVKCGFLNRPGIFSAAEKSW